MRFCMSVPSHALGKEENREDTDSEGEDEEEEVEDEDDFLSAVCCPDGDDDDSEKIDQPECIEPEPVQALALPDVLT
jgi:hypothetical protein